MIASKTSAVAAVTASLGSEQGREVARSRGASGQDEADLFAALDDELEGFALSADAPPKRRVGRPDGSPNRSTLKLKGLLLARGYRDPAEGLAALGSMDARQLAANLAGHGDPKRVSFDQAREAMMMIIRAREGLMPYFHQKMPLAVHHSGEQPRPLIIINEAKVTGGGGAADRGMSVHEPIDAEIVQQYQVLGDGAPAASDDGASDEQA